MTLTSAEFSFSCFCRVNVVRNPSLSFSRRLQHYICWSELPVPRIAVTFSLQEVEEIERDCALYRGRLERIAKHSAVSREEQVLQRERFSECSPHIWLRAMGCFLRRGGQNL